jgi:hypothetical protein
LSTELKNFIYDQAITRAIKNSSAIINGAIGGICKGSFDPNVFIDPCLTQGEKNDLTDLGNSLYSLLGQYSAQLKSALGGATDCPTISQFLSELLAAGISISVNGCTASIHTNYISFNCAGCIAYAGTDKLYLECDQNSVLINYTGVFVNRKNGDIAGLDLSQQKIYMRKNTGEYVEASPERFFLTDGQDKEVEVKPNFSNITGSSDYVITGEKTTALGKYYLNTSGEIYISNDAGNYLAFGTTLPQQASPTSDHGIHAQVQNSSFNFISNDGNGKLHATMQGEDKYSKITSETDITKVEVSDNGKDILVSLEPTGANIEITDTGDNITTIKATPVITAVNIGDGSNNSSVSVWASGVDVNFGQDSPDLQVNPNGLYASIPSSKTQLNIDQNGLLLDFDTSGNAHIEVIDGEDVYVYDTEATSKVTVQAGPAGVRATSDAGQVVVWGNADVTWNASNPQNVDIVGHLGVGLYSNAGNKTEFDTERLQITDSDSGETVVLDVPRKGGSDNGDRLSAKWREIDICVNGSPKKAMVLMSDPYDSN